MSAIFRVVNSAFGASIYISKSLLLKVVSVIGTEFLVFITLRLEYFFGMYLLRILNVLPIAFISMNNNDFQLLQKSYLYFLYKRLIDLIFF